MWAAVWTNIKKPDDLFFNFPFSSVPHLTVFLIPLLQTLIYTWIFFAIFVFFYFSVDWFPNREGIIFRNVCHVAASIFMGYYVIYIVWFVPLTYVSLASGFPTGCK